MLVLSSGHLPPNAKFAMWSSEQMQKGRKINFPAETDLAA
jgi:hypothetical protein